MRRQHWRKDLKMSSGLAKYKTLGDKCLVYFITERHTSASDLTDPKFKLDYGPHMSFLGFAVSRVTSQPGAQARLRSPSLTLVIYLAELSGNPNGSSSKRELKSTFSDLH